MNSFTTPVSTFENALRIEPAVAGYDMPFGMTDHGGISGFLIFKMINLHGGYRNHPKSKLTCEHLDVIKSLWSGHVMA